MSFSHELPRHKSFASHLAIKNQAMRTISVFHLPQHCNSFRSSSTFRDPHIEDVQKSSLALDLFTPEDCTRMKVLQQMPRACRKQNSAAIYCSVSQEPMLP